MDEEPRVHDRHHRRDARQARNGERIAARGTLRVGLASPDVFTVEALVAGVVAAYVVGLSKTGLPGSGLIAIPLFAIAFEGRLIPGATLPILICADLFAVHWYRLHTRWDLLRPLAIWVGLGYAIGITFFVVVGSATRSLEIAIGGIVVVIVTIQLWRMFHGAPNREADTVTAAVYGTTGGFTTFVANAAGPVINTYLVGLGLPKHEHLGTSAWLYFAVNVSKIPFYLALGAWTSGGPFFTRESLLFGLLVVPGVLAGVFSGRSLFHRIPQRTFLVAVLLLSAAGAVRLIL
jgi:uncharacterized protein